MVYFRSQYNNFIFAGGKESSGVFFTGDDTLYTDGTCMNRFTREQANRSVCGLVNYRPAVYTVTGEEGRDVLLCPRF